METLKQEIERTVRKFYGFGTNIAVKDVEVQFRIETSSNGLHPISQKQSTPRITKRPYKKRGGSMSLHREYTTSKVDVACMRHFFTQWGKEGILKPDEENFIAQTKGVYYKSLSEETKTRMREIFEGVRERILFTKKTGEEARF